MTAIAKTRVRELATAPPEHGIILTPPDRTGLHVVVEPIDETWLAAFYVDTHSGVPAIVEVRVVPMSGEGYDAELVSTLVGHKPLRSGERPEQPLAARSLQRLRPGRALQTFKSIPSFLGEENLAKLGISRDMLEAAPDRRRKHRPAQDRWLATVATIYLAAVEAGSAKPVVVTQETLNAERSAAPLSATKVRDIIVQARRHGLLERPEQGGTRRPGGQLTAKAKRLLAAK